MTMAEVRARKQQATPQKQQQQDEDRSKSKTLRRSQPDLELKPLVLAGIFIAFTVLVGSFLYYKVDHHERGPFASWVNSKYAAIERSLNRPSSPLFGASAQETTGQLRLTEAELKVFDGTDDQPIYLAINGTIFDVSVSPAFYGPGGHYHHFVGRDATRAWITECWDEEEQFTWRLDGVSAMFMPKYLDEQLEKAGKGEFDVGDLSAMPQDMIKNMAQKAMERFGSVTDGEKKKRRAEDVVEAEAKVQETLAHWVNFFSGNEKYKVVGSVVLDEKPEPPEPCDSAMKKRPMKGGKLEALMGASASMMQGGKGGAQAGTGDDGKPKGEMPEFVKKKLAEDKAKKEKEEAAEAVSASEDDDELVHEEL